MFILVLLLLTYLLHSILYALSFATLMAMRKIMSLCHHMVEIKVCLFTMFV